MSWAPEASAKATPELKAAPSTKVTAALPVLLFQSGYGSR